MPSAVNLDEFVRDVPDFPKPGIVFKDITPLLAAPDALREAAHRMGQPFKDAGVTKVAAAEARGFLFGPSVAMALGVGFVPVRKPGKLPGETRSKTYDLEYGTDELQVRHDAFSSGDRVLLCDDLLATGGTMAASADLVTEAGAELVGFTFLIELLALNGRERLGEVPIAALIAYE